MKDTNRDEQDDGYRIPELKEALEATKEEALKEKKKKVVHLEDVPPPPGDWITHPVTRVLSWIILIGILGYIALNAREWWLYAQAHPYGASIVVVVVVAMIVLIALAYWKTRVAGKREDKYWDTD